MARTARQEFLVLLKQVDDTLTALFATRARDAQIVLLREAGPDGTIPKTRLQAVRDEIGVSITTLFLGRASNGDLAPFEVIYGAPKPLSPYMAALWAGIQGGTRIAVQQQSAIMEKKLSGVPGILAALKAAKRNPFAVARRVSELSGWQPRPFLAYDPAHRFVWPDGYSLSNRIWRIGADSRNKVDALLADGILSGRSAVTIAKDLEQFLVPGRQLVRTNKPYGRDVSYDAMRLARTEITANNARAGWMAAQLNPFIEAYNVVLSGSHPTIDVCDVEETGGPYPIEDMSHLPPFHPHCLCRNEWVMVQDTAAVIEEMQTMLFEPVLPDAAPNLFTLVGPLMVEWFTKLLLSEPDSYEEYVA